MGLHMPELIIVLVVAMLIFGPKKLPEMGSAIGRSIQAFRKGMHEISNPDDPELPASTSNEAVPDADSDNEVNNQTGTSSPRAQARAEKQAD